MENVLLAGQRKKEGKDRKTFYNYLLHMNGDLLLLCFFFSGDTFDIQISNETSSIIAAYTISILGLMVGIILRTTSFGEKIYKIKYPAIITGLGYFVLLFWLSGFVLFMKFILLS